VNQFLIVWRNFGRSFVLYFDEFLLLLVLSALQGFALVTLILAPPVAAGISVITNRMAQEKRVGWAFFWEGLREHFWRSYAVLGVWVIVAFLLAFNVYFYFRNTGSFLQYFSFVWASLVLIWVSFLPYLLPVMLETEPPALRIIYRNAIILSFSQPLYTFMLMIQLLLLGVLTWYLPFLLFLAIPAMIALLGSLGTRYLIAGMTAQD
jgi:uncharacterized membrane protein YesL